MRYLKPLVVILIAHLSACGDDESNNPISPNNEPSEIDALALPIIDGEWTVGMVIGLMWPDGTTETRVYGKVEVGGEEPTADTLFEIGSISKTFTSLALADMVVEGTVFLDQAVQSLLPAGEVTMPSDTAEITLEHLSTHTSGLPRMPDNVNPTDPENPYADYTASEMYAFLNGHSLQFVPGNHWEYSNLGVGLLGHALARTDGVSWEELIESRVTTPLGLVNTAMTLSANQQQRFAQGHDAELAPVPPWEFDVLAGAGALRSSATDMLSYLAAQTGVSASSLTDAMQSTHQSRYAISNDMDVGLAWFINDDRYTWHNGGTYGFGTFAGFDRQSRAAVTVLCNTFTTYGAETALGLELLKLVAGESYAPAALPATLVLQPWKLAKYAGRYSMSGSGSIDVELSNTGHLFFHLPGQSPYRMFASDNDVFYLRVAVTEITFECDADACSSFRFEQAGITPFTATREQ